MTELPIHKHFPNASRLIFGCMGLGGAWDNNPVTKENIQQAHHAIDAALEIGINFFDHADIYTKGKAESAFGEVLKQRPDLRRHIILQTKCAIQFADDHGPQRYNFSKEWITQSVEGSLKRLGVEHIDILELHRPDPLMEPEEVAEALIELFQSGKVTHFGVSNMTGAQMRFLQKSLPLPLISNQLEMSLSQHRFVDEGVFGVHPNGNDFHFTAGTLEYCRENAVQLQSWGSLSKGVFSGADINGKSSSVYDTKILVDELASRYDVSPESIVLSWLMRHPAKIQPVIGTSRPERIIACGQAEKIQLTREEWYRLYVSARGAALP